MQQNPRRRLRQLRMIRPVLDGLIVPLVLAGLESLVRSIRFEIRPLGLGLVAAGMLIFCWCSIRFKRASAARALTDPARDFVARGPYRLSRNPMFIGLGLMMLGVGVSFRSVLVFCYAAFRLLRFHRGIVNREEPNMRRRFAGSYEQYVRRVPRWVPV